MGTAELETDPAMELATALAALHPESFGWALACCGREGDDAEDVLQATYLKILSGTARFDGRSTLRTWLFGVIRRTAAEERRRAIVRRLRTAAFALLAPADAIPAPDAADDEAGRSARLSEALRTLPPRQREVLQLVFYHDMTIEEASAVMAVSLGTARTHYERGKARLRERLQGERP